MSHSFAPRLALAAEATHFLPPLRPRRARPVATVVRWWLQGDTQGGGTFLGIRDFGNHGPRLAVIGVAGRVQPLVGRRFRSRDPASPGRRLPGGVRSPQLDRVLSREPDNSLMADRGIGGCRGVPVDDGSAAMRRLVSVAQLEELPDKATAERRAISQTASSPRLPQSRTRPPSGSARCFRDATPATGAGSPNPLTADLADGGQTRPPSAGGARSSPTSRGSRRSRRKPTPPAPTGARWRLQDGTAEVDTLLMPLRFLGLGESPPAPPGRPG
jgi:hypothetical protein